MIRSADLARGRDPDILLIAVPGTPSSLDLEQALTADAELVLANVHEGDLFTYRLRPDPVGDVMVADVARGDDRAVDGLLARRWRRDPKGGTVTVRLRRGIRSPFGHVFTAADYVWSWRRRFAHCGIGRYTAIVAGIESPDCVEALDQWTVRFTVPVNSPIFFRLLAVTIQVSAQWHEWGSCSGVGVSDGCWVGRCPGPAE
jgi:ABC-type transport system substrate-binding protein